MSDYLTTLAARSLGVGPFVEPQLPSAYEHELPETSSLEAAAVEELAGAGERRYTEVDLPLPHRPAAPLVLPQEPPPSPLWPVETIPAEEALPARAAPTLESRRAEERQARPIERDAPAEAATADGPEPEARRAAAPTEQATPLLEPSPPMDGETPRARVSAYSVMPPEVAPAMEAAAPAADDRSPTVHVTIGRLEVRAIAVPAPPARPQRRASAPALSLDDYLRRRAGARP